MHGWTSWRGRGGIVGLGRLGLQKVLAGNFKLNLKAPRRRMRICKTRPPESISLIERPETTARTTRCR